MKFFLSAELPGPSRYAVFSSNLPKHESIYEIASEKEIMVKVCQATSDEHSDLLFEELGYFCLQSPYTDILKTN